MFTVEQLADKWFFVSGVMGLCGILFNKRLCMIVMDDPVSISASCGVLLHNILTKIGSYIVDNDVAVAVAVDVDVDVDDDF